MNLIEKAIAGISPVVALRRFQSRQALKIAMHYEAATTGNRGKSWRPTATDADTAAVTRDRLAYVSRDLVRNSPFAVRGQQVIANNVVGDGIIWKVTGGTNKEREQMTAALKQHLDTTDIDADGRNNLFGLQRLAINTIVESGEVLIRRRRRLLSDGLALPFQIEVIEPDFIDASQSGTTADGNIIRDGIEYDQIGRRVAYYLHSEHPGGNWRRSLNSKTRRVLASEILHLYRQDRPGQMRGVSWFAPVALTLRDLADYYDAQLMRQKIAACFAAFRTVPEDDRTVADSEKGADDAGLSELIIPGRIQQLMPGENIAFASPPGVEGFDEFTRGGYRAVAAGLGITYEAMTGDLSGVNFSSGRMGRMEMDRNISSWQWLMMIPQMMQPLGAWLLEGWGLTRKGRFSTTDIDWVPPHRMMVDPSREITALRDKVRAGFASRSGVVRELGYDAEDLMTEIEADAARADAKGMIFDSDPRRTSAGGQGQQATDKGATNVKE